ncbi:hypothetical protein HK102_010419 [Quaeritorhiza haematococci]|nr:hypothetical protein HK102_010419 [Quaeritorhiza haematococci]
MLAKSLAVATVLALVGQASANPTVAKRSYRNAPVRHNNAIAIDEKGNTWETPGVVYIGWDNGYGIKCDDGALWLCTHDQKACNRQHSETICAVGGGYDLGYDTGYDQGYDTNYDQQYWSEPPQYYKRNYIPRPFRPQPQGFHRPQGAVAINPDGTQHFTPGVAQYACNAVYSFTCYGGDQNCKPAIQQHY